MAIMNRHENPRYVIKEYTLSTEKRKDYARVANEADKKRQIKAIMLLSKRKINKKNKVLTKNKNIRGAIWASVLGLIGLWLMYMSG